MSDNSKTQKDNLILPTFLMMLLDVADLIFEKMDPMDLLTTRKVSRGLRKAVDKFGIRFDKIHFWYCFKLISLYFDETVIRYSKNEDGNTTVTHNGQEIVIESENYVEMALNDLKPLLQSNCIKLSMNKYEEELYTNPAFLTTLIAWLKSENCVRVDYLGLSDFLFDEVLTILPYLDAKTLKVICLDGKEEFEQFERITYLKQWTNDIKFILHHPSKFNIDQIEHLFHIKSFEIPVDEFSVQNAIKIRDDLMKRSTFDSCAITFDASKVRRIDIANVFDLDSTRRYPWRFEYSNKKDRFWIKIGFNYRDSVYTLYVKRKETSKMKQNNLILPTLPKLPLDVVDLVAEKLEHMHRNSPQKSNNCSKIQLNGLFQPSLLDIPLDVADLVFEKMESMDLLRTRKVCRGFRAAVDRFGVRFDTIYFTMYDNHIEMSLDEECIAYNDADSGGTTVAYNEQKSVIDNGNFVEMALNDLKMLLKCAPNLFIYKRTGEKDDMIITSFLDFLETEECIHIKGIHFECLSFDDIIAILPYCDAQTLEDIRVMGYGSSDELKAIFNFDQWKMAKRFVFYNKFYNEKFEMKLFEHLFHFEEFKIESFCELSVQDAIKIRDDLLKRSTFKKCRIRLLMSDTTEVFEIAKVFIPDVDSKENYNFEYSKESSRFKIRIGKADDDYKSSWFIVTRL